MKTNFAEVLRRELHRPRWSFEMVALGTVTDCYQPAEGRYRLTRAALEALREVANPVGMVTKSPMVLRDLDILADIARVAKVRIFFTITTMDSSLWRTLEPGTANPLKRLTVMQRLVEAGVPAGVLLAPIMPGITDSAASLEAVASVAREHKAAFFGTSALRLTAPVKQNYLEFLDGTYPDLLPRYERAYTRVNAPTEYQRALDARVERIRLKYGFEPSSFRRHDEDEFSQISTDRVPSRHGPRLLLPMVVTQAPDRPVGSPRRRGSVSG